MKQTAAQLVSQGYAIISRRHRIVARIDRPDWREAMAALHPQGKEWVQALGLIAAADYYRRCVSPDRVTVPMDYLPRMPSSGSGPTGFYISAPRPRLTPPPPADLDEFPYVEDSYPEPLLPFALRPEPPPLPPLRLPWHRRVRAWLRRHLHVHSCATAPDGHLRLNLEPSAHHNTGRYVGYTCISCGQYVTLGFAHEEEVD